MKKIVDIFYIPQVGWIKQKTIPRYCPFKKEGSWNVWKIFADIGRRGKC
jgi:hypothetical protein